MIVSVRAPTTWFGEVAFILAEDAWQVFGEGVRLFYAPAFGF
jgi:hypothetical protein